MAPHLSKSEIAIRVAAAGLGAAVAGPLGGAIGGFVAHVLAGPAGRPCENRSGEIW